MKMPTVEQVNAADRYQICMWWRFVEFNSIDDEPAMARLAERFDEVGGFTPEISKSIGWDAR